MSKKNTLSGRNFAKIITLFPSGLLMFFFYAGNPLNPKDFFSISSLAFTVFAKNNTITILAVVPGPPVVPDVTLTRVCSANKKPTLNLSWPKDTNSDTYKITRNDTLLVDGITETTYTDNTVVSENSYTYTVTAHGILDGTPAISNPIFVTGSTICFVPVTPSLIDPDSFDTIRLFIESRRFPHNDPPHTKRRIVRG